MKFLYRICILLLRGLVKIGPLGAIVFHAMKKVPLERARRERLESYIFGKVALRTLRKQKLKKKKVRKKKKSDSLNFAPISETGLKAYIIRGKRGFYAVCIAFLVFCHKRGLSAFPKAVIWSLKKANINESRLDSMKSRIYGYDITPATASSSVDLIHLETVMNDRVYNRDASHEKLKAFRTIHIFLETSASIPEFLTSDEFSHVNFVIYAFNDQSSYIETLGIADRTRYRPLRDRFNEISPEGVKLFDFCKSLANSVFNVLESHPSDSFKGLTKRQREVMTLGLDGRISARLSLAACYREGFAEVPPTDAILFLAVTATYTVNGWDFYRKVLPPSRSFVLFTTSKLKYREKLTAEYVKTILRRRLKFRTKAKPAEAPPELASKANDLINQMSDAFSRTNDTAQRLVSSLGVRLDNSPCILIAYAEASNNYKVSIEELSRKAIERHSQEQTSIPVLLHCSGSIDRFIAPKLLETTDHESFVSLDFTSLAPIISDNMMTRADSAALIDWIETQIDDECEWMEANIFPIIVTSLAKFFIEQVHWIWAGYSFGSALSENVEIDGSLAMPTRHWLIRSVCAGILDGPQGVRPLIDVQSMNILRHPKYRNPMANHCSVIDNTAQNIYREYFGIPDSQISVVGAPQNDSLQRNLALLDRASIAERMNILPDKKTIVVISQLQPFERMRRIIAPIGELLRDYDDLQLIVRMHPRETKERELNYREVLSKYVGEERINISVDEPAIEVLKASDVCVTIYSNMAREAAIAGIPVITVNYLGWEPPIRLDAEGLAIPSPTPKKLKRNVIEALEKVSLGGRENSSSYMIANPHILEGNSVEKIFEKFDALHTSKNNRKIKLTHKEQAIQGLDLLDHLSSIDLVMTSDNRVADLPPLFKKEQVLKIYNSRSDSERGFIPSTAVVVSGKYSKDVAASVEDAVERGNRWAQKCLDVALDSIKDWEEVHDLIKPLEYSLWLRLRPRLLRPEIEFSNIDQGINGDGESLVICSTSSLMLEFLLKRAMTAGRKSRTIVILQINNNLTYKLMTVADFRENVKHIYPKPPQDVSETLNKKTQIGVRRWLKSIKRVEFEQPPTPRLLISSDWALKTVPGTVTPVVKTLSQSGLSATFANIRSDDLPALQATFETEPHNIEQLDYMTPLKPGEQAPRLQGRHLKTLTYIWQNALVKDAEYRKAAPNIQRLMIKSLDTLGRIWLSENFIWEHYCRQWFQDSRAVSLASPGRQWHAELAHQVAEESGGLAMTLQNAYMTGGYTYTKPTGNYVSAIDQWSKDVFMDAYNVPEENIYVTSTPRFDYLAELPRKDPVAAREILSIDPEIQVVFFAAQIGLEQEAEIMIRELAKMKNFNGKPVMGLVKLHPRTPLADVQRYENYATRENSEHNVVIHHEGDIADFLLASDVVITAYSNVGIEAAILRKPLIVAKLTEAPLPLPMDEFKIGYVAKNGADISFAIEQFFTSNAFLKTHLDMQDDYRTANPAMVEGSSTKIIATAIDAALNSENVLDAAAE